MEKQLLDTAVSQTARILIISRHPDNNHKLIKSAHNAGLTSLTRCENGRLYFLQGTLTSNEVEQIAAHLLTDPVTEEVTIDNSQLTIHNSRFIIETTLLPGVTDPPAENLVHTAHMLGINGLERAATGQQFILTGNLSNADKQRLAAEILANPVVQRFAIDQPITAPFFPTKEADETIDHIPVRDANDEELLAISHERRLALDLGEMQAMRAYYQKEGRDATDIELEMIAQTWSEHCVHKTFRAIIDYTGPDGEKTTIDSLLNTYLRAATNEINKPWVHSAFVDNAGIIAFDDTYDLAFKAETHNHPSALEPFGGANTGVGGVVRDILGVSARPIANTDVLCFGQPDMPQEDVPEGVLHPRHIADGVIHGIEDYGNKMGIPTVNGSIHYHPGYTANPLVYCGCLGILPCGSHRTEPQAGDLVIAIGGRTGRDGLRGATFSSMEMDVETSEIAGTAVQIGHPIMEKQVQEVVLRARDEELYTAITDCGAGGYSSAVGEMGQTLGAVIQLTNVTLKYPGLRPWEIWLSEAQERMVFAVPPENLARMQALCDGQDVELTQLGTFGNNGRLHLYYGDTLVGDLSMSFLHDGIPQRRLSAEWKGVTTESLSPQPSALSSQPSLLALLAHPNIRSKEDVIRRYDHEVQGGTAVKPLVGIANHGPSDATVLVPQNSQLTIHNSQFTIARGAALSNGINPHYGELDPYAMAWSVIDEAMRNIVAVGTDPDQVSILDNFCWGNPSLPDRLGALVRCAQGCYDAAIAYQTPFISGKDSLNNEYTGADGKKHAIPGTLLISALGIVPDVNKTATMDLKTEGNFLFVVGETKDELGGSHYFIINNQHSTVNSQHLTIKTPQPVENPLVRYRAMHQAIQAGLVQACHDCSEGGLVVALAEMCLAGGLGASVALDQAPGAFREMPLQDDVLLFSETNGRFLVEVKPDDAVAFKAALKDVPHAQVGVVKGEALIVNGRSQSPLINLPISDLNHAWCGHLNNLQLSIVNRPSPIVNRQSSIAQSPSLNAQPKVLILHANGSNRDHDAVLACELAGGAPEIVHINQLLQGERILADYHMLVIPGGFSYGDDLGAGVLWATMLREQFGNELHAFVQNGRPVLGICNGFQTLVKSGVLDTAVDSEPASMNRRSVTLTYNASAQFECRWVYLEPNPNSPCLFTKGLTEPIYCPVAHGEGRLAVSHDAVAEALQNHNLIPLQYANRQSSIVNRQSTVGYPANPNGSALDIAALCNPAGNVMGLMPHPENHIFSWQHPRTHRGESGMDGLRLFANGIKNA